MKMSGLAHVGLFIKDVEVSKKFYTEILGFETIEEVVTPGEDGDTKVAFVKNGNLVLELVQFPKFNPVKDGLVDHFAIAVEDIEACKKALEEKGIEFESDVVVAPGVFPNGSKWVLFRGPDGEHLELTEVAPY